MDKQEMFKKVTDKAIKIGGVLPVGSEILERQYLSILFSHEFAEAFFGNDVICTCGNESTEKDYVNHICPHPVGASARKAWKNHLQQAVISKDPLEYYFKHL